MKKLGSIIVLAGGVLFSALASATEHNAHLRCTELEELVIELSRTDVAPTRDPLVRDHIPEKNYIWCLGIGFATLGKEEITKPVILSFGTEPDGTLWLEFYERRGEPSFEWKYTRSQ